MGSRLATAGICSMVVLAACGGGGGNGGGVGGDRRSGGNSPPSISGSPTLSVLDGEFYDFRPQAEDADGDRLRFAIANKPPWARFDSASGRLSGTPGEGDAGIHENIVISVTDGQATAALAGFDVAVNEVGEGAAVLSWHPPTENNDGTTLTDLAGYRIYYGRHPKRLDDVIALDNPGLTSYVVENLSAARWFFRMTSLNASGVESARSKMVTKRVT